MSNNEFIERNIGFCQALCAILTLKGLDIERDNMDSDLPHLGSSHGGYGEGMYIRIRQYKSLTDDQFKQIKSIFPLSIEGYELRLHSIGDFDYDEDRMWRPSVQFGIYKHDANQLISTI